jgi:hypothetical protein
MARVNLALKLWTDHPRDLQSGPLVQVATDRHEGRYQRRRIRCEVVRAGPSQPESDEASRAAAVDLRP